MFWILKYEWYTTKTATYFGITRKTLHKWLNRFNEKILRILEEHSKAPIKTRVWEVTNLEEERIISLRKNITNIKFSRLKGNKRTNF